MHLSGHKHAEFDPVATRLYRVIDALDAWLVGNDAIIDAREMKLGRVYRPLAKAREEVAHDAAA